MEILPSYYRHFLQLSHFFSFCTLKKVKRIYLHVRMTLPIFIALALLVLTQVLWPFNRLMVGSLLIFAKNLFSFLSSVLTLALLCPVFTLCESALFAWFLIPAPLSIILQLPSSQSGCHVYWGGGAANFKSHLSIWHWILRKPELMPFHFTSSSSAFLLRVALLGNIAASEDNKIYKWQMCISSRLKMSRVRPQTLSHPILLLSLIPDFRGRLDVEECRTWLGLELPGT